MKKDTGTQITDDCKLFLRTHSGNLNTIPATTLKQQILDPTSNVNRGIFSIPAQTNVLPSNVFI